MTRVSRPLPSGPRHLDELAGPLADLRRDAERLERWGRRIASLLAEGARVLAAGNGGSAAQASHLTSELVGRYRDDRPPFSAICLTAETSSLTAIALAAEPAAVTAIANDYGAEEVFARQVRGHGRADDVLVALSTSGRSLNVLAAVEAAHDRGMLTLALSGPPGNPLADRCHDALCVASPHTATIQEIHLIAIHLLCAAVDQTLIARAAPAAGEALV
jgi:D-sedoheptulose 7-phosphate isomerase